MYILMGIKGTQATAGTSTQRPRLPITAALLWALKSSWEAQGPGFNRSMLWAVATICYIRCFALGRSNCVVAVVIQPRNTSVYLTCRRGLDTGPTSCGSSYKSIQDGPVPGGSHHPPGQNKHRSMPRGGYIAERGLEPGPLFIFRDKRPLTRQALVSELRVAFSRAGVDPAPYSGHSFRNGAATIPAAARVEDAIIKILGRCHSDAYQAYIKLPRESLVSIAALLAQQ